MNAAEPVPNRRELDGLFRSDPWMREVGATLTDWGGGWATVAWTPEPRHRNFSGQVHGGALFSLADAAFAVASNSWGRMSVALTVEIQFLAAAPVGGALVADARERSRTRRTASYLIEVSDDDGELVVSFQAMVFRTARWHLGDDAWPDDWRERH